MTERQRTCTDCGTPLQADDDQPVCAACIFRRLASTGSTIPSSDTRHTSPAADKHDTDFYSEYELLGEIGRGGMGVIYKAHQARLNRIVALKVINAANIAGEAARRRFQSEVEVAARLNHPNIVPIFDTGAMDGSPCFSMEFFSGGSLAEQMQLFTSQPEEGVRLLVKVARAISFAHQHGVLHRDLKPANILLDASGEPHVCDFGLAKQLDSDSDMTRSGAVIGSPNYMSPEQAAGKSNSLTVATDIYSLGVILYQMLTGRTPFLADTPLETMRLVVETEPVPPSQVRRTETLTENPITDQRLLTSADRGRIDRDLETICLKCLEKEPGRRYRTAEELAEDLEHWLLGEPIKARPATGFERLQKWARRRPALATLSAMLCLVCVFAFAGIVWQWRKAESARRNETRQLRRAEATLTRLELEKADSAFLGNDSRQAIAYLAHVLRRDPSNAVAGSRLMSVMEQRPFARPDTAALEFDAIPNAFALSTDGSRAIVGFFNRSAQICDAANAMKPLRQFRLPGRMALARFSRDARYALTITEEGTAQLWDVSLDKPLAEATSDESTRQARNSALLTEFGADDQYAASFSPTTGLRIWDVRAGTLRNTFIGGSKGAIAAMSSGAKEFALAETNTVQIWALPTLSRPCTLKLSATVAALAIDEQRQTLAVGDENGELKLFKIATGAEVLTVAAHPGAIRHLVFSPDGQTLISASGDGLAFWNVATGGSIGAPIPLVSRPRQIEFSSDGGLLLVRPDENFLSVYKPTRAQLHLDRLRESGFVCDAHFTPDGNRVLVATRARILRTWDVQGAANTKNVIAPESPVSVLTVSPDGKTLAIAGTDGKVVLRNLTTDKAYSEPFPTGGEVRRLLFSPGGRYLVAERSDETLHTCNLSNGTFVTSRFIRPIAHWEFLPEAGAKIILVQVDGSVVRRSLAEQEATEQVFNLGAEIHLAQFSPDRARLTVEQSDGKIALWDVATGKKLREMEFRAAGKDLASFSPDGNRAVTASVDGSAKVWDARTAEIVLPPIRNKGAIMHALFSPDGRVIATTSSDFEARLWDAQTARALTPPLAHRTTVTHIRFSANGKRLVTVTRDWTARVWDVGSGLPLTNPLPFSRVGLEEGLALTPDGKTLAIVARNRTVRLCSVPEPSGPVPEWLLETAEALAGFRQDADGILTPIPVEHLHTMMRRIHASTATDDFSRWAKHVFTSD